jgi:potassium efflux system protein
MKYCRIVSVGFALGWVLTGFTCLGQEAASSTAETSRAVTSESSQAKSPPPPEAIPPADITSQATEVAARLEQIEATIHSSPGVAKLALEFSKQAQTVAELRNELDHLNSANATSRQIEDQRRAWKQQQDQIDGWNKTADDRWKDLQQTRLELGQTLKRWELTRDAKYDNELPVEVQSRIDQIIARIEKVQTALQLRIDQLAEFIERLTDAGATTGTALGRLGKITENINRRLLNRDAPVLWQTQEAEWLALNDTTRQTAARWFHDLRAFAADNSFRLIVHLALFVVLAVGAIMARRSSDAWPDDEHDLDRARFLVSRPFSVALVFAILTGYFIYGPLPNVARDFFYFLLLVPVLRLAAGLTTPPWRAALYGLLILAGLFPFVQFCPEGSLLTRVLLLVTEIAAIGIVGYAIRRGAARNGNPRTWWSSALLVTFICVFILFVVALLANTFGWVSLARFMTESTLLTCKGALLAIVIGVAGAGLLPAIMRQGPGQALLSVRRHTASFERAGIVLLTLVLLFIWSQQTLRRFRLEELLAERAQEVLTTPFSWNVNITIGDVLKAVVILTATFFVQRLLSLLLNEELFPRLHMRTSSTAVFATLLKYAIVAAGLGMAGSALGFTATQLTVLVGALGVGIGFGLQSIVNNFVSGLILMFERPIKIGDIVDVDGNRGTVKKIGVRATAVQAFDGAEIVVPNGDLISKEVRNLTLSDNATRVELLVGVAYGSVPREVLEVLLRAARENEFVFSDPEPFAMMYGFGDSALNFRLLCWTSFDKRGLVISQVHVAVYEALAEAGIEIPFPQRDLHLKPTDNLAAELDRMTHAN